MLAATPCRCGAQRQTWQPFCPSCYGKLPATLKAAVRRADAGTAIEEAKAFLEAWDRDQAAKRARLTAR